MCCPNNLTLLPMSNPMSSGRGETLPELQSMVPRCVALATAKGYGGLTGQWFVTSQSSNRGLPLLVVIHHHFGLTPLMCNQDLFFNLGLKIAWCRFCQLAGRLRWSVMGHPHRSSQIHEEVTPLTRGWLRIARHWAVQPNRKNHYAQLGRGYGGITFGGSKRSLNTMAAPQPESRWMLCNAPGKLLQVTSISFGIQPKIWHGYLHVTYHIKL